MSDIPSSPGSSPLRAANLRIPEDQDELLQRPDSWIGRLKEDNNPLGLVNLPADTLAQLTEFHRKRHYQTRTNRQENENRSSPEADAESDDTERHENEGGGEPHTPAATATNRAGATGASQVVIKESAQASTPTKQPESSAGTQSCSSSPEVMIPWSPSPSQVRNQESTSRTVAPPESTATSDAEEELGVVAARGIRDTTTATGRDPDARMQSSPAFTASRPPPCGQGAGHLARPDGHSEEEPKQKGRADLRSTEERVEVSGRRPRRMQNPVFSSVPIDQQRTAHFDDHRFAAARIPPAALHLSMLDSSQTSVSGKGTPSSPLKSSSSPPGQSSGLGKRPEPQVGSSDLNDGPRPKRSRASHGVPRREVLVPETPSSRPSNLAFAGRTLNTSQYLKPFELYTNVYPSYLGGLSDFIRACICLDYFQKEEPMRDFLYDDFIRVFAHDYVNYVAASPVSPLPAQRWFNLLRGKPLFDQMVITRDNLHLVFEAYPEEFQAVMCGRSSQHQDVSQTPGRRPPTRPGSAQGAHTHLNQITPNSKLYPGHVPATLPRASHRGPEAWATNKSESRRHSEMAHYQHVPFTFGSQASSVVPATQSPMPMGAGQGSWTRPVQDSLFQRKGERAAHPHSPYSASESPFKRVVTPQGQSRHFQPPHNHSPSEPDSREDLVPEKRSELSISKIYSTVVIPLGMQGAPSGTIDMAQTLTPKANKVETNAGETSTRRHVVNSQHAPTAEKVTLDVHTSPSGSTPHDISLSAKVKDDRIRNDASFNGRDIRSPLLSNAPSVASGLTQTHGPSEHQLAGTRSPVAEAESARRETPSANIHGRNIRHTRQAESMSKPDASRANESLKKVTSGRVQKETVHKVSPIEKKKRSSGVERGQKKPRMTREEALREFMKKKQAERASAPSTPRS